MGQKSDDFLFGVTNTGAMVLALPSSLLRRCRAAWAGEPLAARKLKIIVGILFFALLAGGFLAAARHNVPVLFPAPGTRFDWGRLMKAVSIAVIAVTPGWFWSILINGFIGSGAEDDIHDGFALLVVSVVLTLGIGILA